MKNKKIIIGIIVVVVLVAAAIVVAVCVKKSGDNAKKIETTETVAVTTKVDKDAKKKDAKKEKQKETAWDGVEVVEENTKADSDKQVLYKRNKKGEIVTNKKGEKVTRKPKYAGEDEGWSPIVTPDDLKK